MIPNPLVSQLYPDLETTPAAPTALGDHRAEFALAGIQAMRRRPAAGEHYNDRIE